VLPSIEPDHVKEKSMLRRTVGIDLAISAVQVAQDLR
jgi:hypothetical protein